MAALERDRPAPGQPSREAGWNAGRSAGWQEGWDLGSAVDMVVAADQAIPPAAQRQVFAPGMGAMTVEVSTNHVARVSHPDEVLQLIRTAAQAVPAST
jgi:hypothetical protein